MAVNMADLPRATMLASEKEGLLRAIEALGEGRSIENMSIVGVIITTANMRYPEQMADALKGEINRRVEELNQELTSMGVDTTPPVAPAPQAAAPKGPRGKIR